jgi:YegS/Rv2252/BmrU family lipid kinase
MFLNRGSGARRPEEISALVSAAESAGIEVVAVDERTRIEVIVRERQASRVRNFFAAGGDGTINHVAQAIVSTDSTLGVIPLGTFNHFAYDLGVPLDWSEALEVALRGEVRQIDVGRVNTRYFLNNISLGVYPPFVEEKETRRHYGRWRAYPYAAYVIFKRAPHVSIAVETEHRLDAIRTHMFLVSNNPYDLGRIGLSATRPTLESGTLAVYWLDHMPKLALIRTVARYVRGKATDEPGFRSMRTRQLRVQATERTLRIGIDGELLKLDTPLVIQSVPKSLLVRVPRQRPEV